MVIIGAHAIIIARKSICAHCAALTNNIIIFYTINKLDCIALVIHNRSERPILKNSADGKLDAVESAFFDDFITKRNKVAVIFGKEGGNYFFARRNADNIIGARLFINGIIVIFVNRFERTSDNICAVFEICRHKRFVHIGVDKIIAVNKCDKIARRGFYADISCGGNT